MTIRSIYPVIYRYFGGLIIFEMNNVEVKILEEVKNGRTEILFTKETKDIPKEEIPGTFIVEKPSGIYMEKTIQMKTNLGM